MKIIFILLFSINTFAQSTKDLKEALAKLDTSAFKGKAFLNKAIFVKSLIEPLQKKEKSKDGMSILTLTPYNFRMLTNIIEKADLNDKVKPKAITDFQTRNIDQITSNNTIPIGIINADALFLTQQQLDDNTKAKSQSLVVDGKSYENIELIVAGLMQGDIYQGNVSFQISPTLLQSNIDNPIQSIEIDFQDGKGFQKYEFKEQLIPYQFKTIGEVAIAIKLVTKRGSYLTYNILKVNQLVRPIPYSDKNVVTAKKVIQDNSKGSRITDNVVGAEYVIFTGCDNLFDKPVIIAEGFDVNEDVNIDVLVAKYYPYLYAFRNNGYDLVFVNYNDGRDYIQNNAQVLKRVIREVNSRKVGSNKIAVIGESMSGLVVRWALKEMENQGETHQVSHFISFDSPQKGANLPAGLVKLRRFATGAYFPYSLIADELNNCYNYVPALKAMDTPAGRQLLLCNTDIFLSPHPDYYTLQNDLNNLGYPSQGGIKNIAMLNGALSGTLQNKFSQNAQGNPVLNGLIQPGDKILEGIYFYILANLSVNAWTNVPNQSTKIFEGFSWILFPFIGLPAYERSSITTPRNLDRISGGRTFFNFGSVPTNFSFVPAYSAIDYKGALNNDADYSLQISDINNPNNPNAIIDGNFRVKASKQSLTPFSSIYGNDIDNTTHSLSDRIVNSWNQLAVTEGFGIANANSVLSSCVPNLPLPPNVLKVVIGAPQCTSPPKDGGKCSFGVGYVTFPSFTCGGSDPIPMYLSSVSTGYLPNTIQQFIRITGNGITRVYDSGRRNLRIDDLPPGTYTVSSVVRYYNPDLTSRLFPSNDEKSVSTTLTISGECRIASCPGSEGELAIWLTDTDEGCLSYQTNSGQWFAITSNGIFVSRSRLIANGMSTNSANCFAETDPRTGTLPACDCGFTLITANQNSGQYTGQYTFNSCSAAYHKWQLLSGTTEIANSGADPYQVTSANVTINIPTSVNSGSYSLKVDATNCTGTGTQPFNYTKPGGNSLSLNQSTWSPSSSANTQSVSVTSNIGWSVSTSDGSWLTASPTSGSNNGSFTISTTANGSTTSRSGTITVSGLGVTSQTVSVTQAGTGGGGGTTDRTEGGIASDDGASNPGGEGEANAFDNMTNTKWLVFNPTGNIAYDFNLDDAYAINSYTVTSANDAPDRDPKNWNLQGSNDNSNWTTVDSQNNQYYGGRFETKTFNIANTTAYKQYRLNVTANNGSGLLQIAEIQMFGPASSGGGGGNPSCSYTNGQFLTEWFGNEIVRAYICGTKYYAKNDAGYFKSRSWLTGTGRFTAAELACFEEVNPGCGGLRVAAEFSDDTFEVYPNPTSGKIKVGFTLQKDENVWFNLYDTQGKNLQLNDFEGKAGSNFMEIDLQYYPSGAYFIDLQYNQKREIRKVVKVN